MSQALFEKCRDHFRPELRARKRRAAQAAEEKERRNAEAKLVAELGAIAASPVIQEYRQKMLDWGSSLMPVEGMPADACYWMRRGLEQAVRVLDDMLATAEEDDA